MLLGLRGPVSETIPHAYLCSEMHSTCSCSALIAGPYGEETVTSAGGGGTVHSLTQLGPELITKPLPWLDRLKERLQVQQEISETGIRTIFPELN